MLIKIIIDLCIQTTHNKIDVVAEVNKPNKKPTIRRIPAPLTPRAGGHRPGVTAIVLRNRPPLVLRPRK